MFKVSQKVISTSYGVPMYFYNPSQQSQYQVSESNNIKFYVNDQGTMPFSICQTPSMPSTAIMHPTMVVYPQEMQHTVQMIYPNSEYDNSTIYTTPFWRDENMVNTPYPVTPMLQIGMEPPSTSTETKKVDSSFI
ncbi:hypothetical protein RF11_10972 [Thelohanellus kitauei]|uniref:Uncharacterized protein n=1 Tax=Thelohanellus kitauei TaxID=669202 RepID=A0A0C2MM22_THEKT|nr:hypothetical protein RF11_10972 [Thelohanellus kitauei]